MKKGVFIKEWLAFKPYQNQVGSDFFYLSLCQKIYQCLERHLKPLHWDQQVGSKQQLLVDLACFLASYLEDLASGTQLWLTFVKLHEEQYDQLLPLVEQGDDYITGEPNKEDIIILIWYFINSVQDKIVFSEKEIWLQKAAEDIFDLLVEQWEMAPENQELQQFYRLGTATDTFFEVRKLLAKILFQTYLFFPDTKMIFEERLKSNLRSNRNIHMLNWETETDIVHNQPTRLLGIYANDWLAAILGIQHPLFGSVKNMSRKIPGLFEVERVDDRYIHLTHLSSGNRFPLYKGSYDHKGATELDGKYLYLSIVKWKNDWWLSGVSNIIDKRNEEIEREEKNILQARLVEALLDPNWRSVQVRQGMNIFLEVNGNNQIAIGSAPEMLALLATYEDELSKSDDELLKQLSLQRVDVIRRFIQSQAYAKMKVTLLYTPDMGLEVSFGLADAFPAAHHKDVDLSRSGVQFLQLLTDASVSRHKVLYCIQHFRHDLPYFKSEDGIQVLKNLDFLLRFWKTDQYHSIAL